MKNKTRITTITITKVALSTAIFFAVYVNGWLWGTVSCILYLLLGFVGVPVFTGFSAGAGKLLGPTGGYMIGYIFLSLVAGFFISKFEKNIPLHILGMVLGTACCYALGTAWLAISYKMSFGAALMAGVVPFILADAIKMAVAVAVGIPVRSAVRKMSVNTDSAQ